MSQDEIRRLRNAREDEYRRRGHLPTSPSWLGRVTAGGSAGHYIGVSPSRAGGPEVIGGGQTVDDTEVEAKAALLSGSVSGEQLVRVDWAPDRWVVRLKGGFGTSCGLITICCTGCVGAPVENAEVTLTGISPASFPVMHMTGHDGCTTFIFPVEGDYTITVFHPGYVGPLSFSIHLLCEIYALPLTFSLDLGGGIFGSCLPCCFEPGGDSPAMCLEEGPTSLTFHAASGQFLLCFPQIGAFAKTSWCVMTDDGPATQEGWAYNPDAATHTLYVFSCSSLRIYTTHHLFSPGPVPFFSDDPDAALCNELAFPGGICSPTCGIPVLAGTHVSPIDAGPCPDLSSLAFDSSGNPLSGSTRWVYGMSAYYGGNISSDGHGGCIGIFGIAELGIDGAIRIVSC